MRNQVRRRVSFSRRFSHSRYGATVNKFEQNADSYTYSITRGFVFFVVRINGCCLLLLTMTVFSKGVTHVST